MTGWRNKTLGTAALALIVGGVFGIVRFWPEAAVPQPKATPTMKTPASADVTAKPVAGGDPYGYAVALDLVQQLLRETEGLKPPQELPLPRPYSQGKADVLAMEASATAPSADIKRPERAVTIGYTGNWIGEIDPCGCLKNPLGGLGRLATYWKSIQGMRRHTLLVDGGNLLLSSASNPKERPGEADARAALYAKVFAHLGYKAMNVGLHDLAFGLPKLQAWGKTAKLSLLSVNLVEQTSGQPVFVPLLVQELGPVKVGLIGVISPTVLEQKRWVADQGLRIVPPEPLVRQQIALARQQGAAIIIVISQLRRNELEHLAQEVPDIDLILGSQDQDFTLDPLEVGKDTFFVDAMHKGKYIDILTLEIGKIPHVLYAARMQQVIAGQQRVAAQRVQGLTAELAQLDSPDSALKLNAETRAEMERQLAKSRAQLQRLTLQMDANTEAPKDATTLDLVARALSPDLDDDPVVAKWQALHQRKYPRPENFR
jgi:2',3'-cyclic-nucleotide 2'-phosphodiesterase (5'-nucleotidase family)